MSCMLVTHESDKFYTNPSVFQRTRNCTNRHHKTYIHFPQPTCTHKTMQRPMNHRVHPISQHPSPHRPYITPSKRIFGSQKACNLIKISRNRLTSIVISHTQSSQRPKKSWHLVRIYLVRTVCSKKNTTSQGHLITAKKNYVSSGYPIRKLCSKTWQIS